MKRFRATTLSGTSSEDESDTNRDGHKSTFIHPSDRKSYGSCEPPKSYYNCDKQEKESSPELSPTGFYSSFPSRTHFKQETSDSSPDSRVEANFYSPTRSAQKRVHDVLESSPDASPSKKSRNDLDLENENKYGSIAFGESSDGGNSPPNNSFSTIPSDSEETTKRPKLKGGLIRHEAPQPIYNDKAQRMMAMMGYKAGTGLGKHSQGRVDIIETSKQRGRRGLGLEIKGLEPCPEIDWEKEEISAEELVEWMPDCTENPPPISELRQWVVEGPKKMTIDDEIDFCSASVLNKVLSCKSIFDNLEPEEMRRARTRSNPFETIRGVLFQNRAAMKMANMDAMFGFMFTKPVTENGDPVLGPNDLLYFSDICAGPGGFSEYILWRKKWEAKGFGFTLKGPNDFKLEEFFAGSPETFEPHYGVGGINGDGNIYVPENLREFRRFVLENTDGKGVHFVMADGGFSVEGEENLQEILSKRLYLSQFLCALSILRTGGHFVCKVFDLFTSFSVGLLYLLYRAFKKICIVKPNTSRPANSERYVVCKWKRDGVKDIEDYLYEVHCRLYTLYSREDDKDVMEIVPLKMLKEDMKFFNYIVKSNELLGEKQALHLAKIQAFCQNTELHEARQSEMRKECLKVWDIPDKVRSAPSRPDPLAKFRELMKGEDISYLSNPADFLDKKKLTTLKSAYDYRCIVSGVEKSNKTERGFVIGLGRKNIFRWDGGPKSRWVKLELALEMPCDTLVYAEVVQELRGEGKAQRKLICLHIIDSIYLGGKNVQGKHFTERVTETQKFVKAISKPSRPDYTPVRVKEVFRLEEIGFIFDRLDQRIVKGGGGMRRLCYSCDEERFFLPHGVIFFKTVCDPWTMAYSRSKKLKYFFNCKTRQSRFETSKDAIASFKDCFSKRLFWPWELGVKVHDSHQEAHEDKIHRDTILEWVKDFINR